MDFYKNKNVLVTGGTGLIGRPLIKKLKKLGANLTVVSLDNPSDIDDSIKFINSDLRILDNCLDVCSNNEIVFNLIGVKGSPKMTMENPASFLFQH